MKYRKSNKTLISLFPKEDKIGLMIIFGRKERDKIEEIKAVLPPVIYQTYSDAKTNHDGKWVILNSLMRSYLKF
ncbi:hypothetical protein J2S17_000376 [Cytobacillus purgationiresistens]|uniref:Uncharacterized protein n=1 Tax=Cytobacillus purgationiresistens TaxID=863449 RepID=A0ABU0ACH7_9BACI|nr:hypothetical protein [Cytobacillus purgationiresistens]